MLTTIVEKGINLESRGGEWILLLAEEAQLAADRGSPFSSRSLFKSLHMTEDEIRAAYQSIERTLHKAGYELGLRKFLKECLS